MFLWEATPTSTPTSPTPSTDSLRQAVSSAAFVWNLNARGANELRLCTCRAPAGPEVSEGAQNWIEIRPDVHRKSVSIGNNGCEYISGIFFVFFLIFFSCFVAGAVLCGPCKAHFVAGAGLCGPWSAEFVRRRTFCGP